MEHIYTFHSHFYAIRFHKKLTDANINGVIMPVPRKISSSCGSCVKATDVEQPLEFIDDGVEQLYHVNEEELELLYESID
ncbi:MAG: DUF3343 domain-containing protein [Eubacteriales bacterium]